jgi:hypothetical protein
VCEDKVAGLHVGVWLRLTSWQEEARRLAEEQEHRRLQVNFAQVYGCDLRHWSLPSYKALLTE